MNLGLFCCRTMSFLSVLTLYFPSNADLEVVCLLLLISFRVPILVNEPRDEDGVGSWPAAVTLTLLLTRTSFRWPIFRKIDLVAEEKADGVLAVSGVLMFSFSSAEVGEI